MELHCEGETIDLTWTNAMKLSKDEIALLRDSFSLLHREEQAASERFYRRLFEIAPELRSMFPADMSEQSMKFMSTLGVILDHLDRPAALEPYLDNLAKGHRAYGVKPEHFPPMGQALIDTMREALGDEFPKDADAAWKEAYDQLAQEMIKRAG